MESKKYKYHFRPEYNSKNLLIAFISGVENENFISDLFNSIVEINPKITEISDLWMNDEYLFEIDSDMGTFLYSKDIWDLAFLMSKDNQECLHKINSILSKDEKFEKVEVNFNTYKS
ncbi:hypothetical protein SY27_02185 [Flavobacterium sp. 316]|uniref:hypothetical protein n=1 Tax=Flavobacterium sp. 316 TaxID=1603293 RepID=UPI0005E44A81|nr:hypothetical protein [Flavobacterium sp. 316]KIX22654.1 hypothetical protein SY27_02185 [Flavobacterium sp. 316]